ncbi:hypothetical protein CEUSTIGMA_g3072.t1 [Chlamydomonas eustigma]|uniref:CDT1 Geminin-binding domain-containing protein n=1 Tax=Chlamydomonas eustigma TaxID=1157962 RepID=A0A250WXQ4_9CHLO|nr:hypothetical protein CEUSTIGMA_g3072.t1 [Chlamydomonas eustigma]|eukprot:GAX75628.1 hypothetical protein CEUSTIGMA_g3072.t1 [Chlamydomonas eustigma]
MFSRKRRGLEMLKASGVKMRPDLPVIKENHNEGASTPDVLKHSGSLHFPVNGSHPSKPTVAVLPEEMRGLLKIWEAILSSKSLLQKRRERVTFNALKPFVESHTNKQFKVEHVQQIKALYPEAFTWQYIRAPISREDKQLEYQLLLRFDRVEEATGQESGTSNAIVTTRVQNSDADEKAVLEVRMVQLCRLWAVPDNSEDQPQEACSPAVETAAEQTLVKGESSGSHPPPPVPPLGTAVASQAARHLSLADLPLKEGCFVITASPMASPSVSRRSGYSSAAASTPSRSTAAHGMSRPTLAGQVLLSPTSHRRPLLRLDSPSNTLQLAGSEGQQNHQTVATTPSSSAAVPGADTSHKRRRLLVGDVSVMADPSPFQPAGLPAGSLASPTGTASGTSWQVRDSQGTPGGLSSALKTGAGPALHGMNSVNAASSRQGSGVSQMGVPQPHSLPPTPSSARRNPLLDRLLSADSLNLLDKVEAARIGSPQLRAKQRQLEAATHLPAAFDLVRVIFGARGSCLRPKEDVVMAMKEKSTFKGGLSSADAQLQLELLARDAPEFLRIETQTPLRDAGVLDSERHIRPRLMVRLDRAADLDAVRRSLVDLAARALEQQQEVPVEHTG